MEGQIIEINSKIEELEEIYLNIEKENEINKDYIKEVEDIQNFNFKIHQSLSNKMKKIVDRFSVSFLVQLIAVLFCLFLILLLKL
jgi:predicted PurR-regulated permease PerM